MKKILLIIITCTLLVNVNAQEIVTTNPQLKNIILEEYTGINCGYCPDGHQIAEEIFSDNPGRTVIINVHTGYYSTPTGTQPDFTTEFGAALASEASVSGYPSGSVNRHIFSELEESSTGMGRDKWEQAANIIKEQSSYVNIGFQSSFDESSREVTVQLETYYVEDLPYMVESNFINVVLTENHVFGYQNGGSSNYDHKHILRYMITGQWGEEITEISQGSLITKTYTYTLPEEWDATNCEISAFVTEGHSETVTGGVAPLIDGEFNGETLLDYGRLNMSEYISSAETGNTATILGNFLVGDTINGDYNFTLTKTQPEDWAVEYSIDGNNYSENSIITLNASQNYPIEFNVTPGETNGVGHYILEITSVNHPTALPKTAEFNIIKGVSNLVVNGSGNFTSINSANYQSVYLNSLENAGSDENGAISALAMAEGFSKGILDDVQNIYMNISYTLPSLSEEQILSLETFIDNGGNLFIAGQDIGWDAMASGGYGGYKMKLFYSNYLNATYSNSGSSDNNEIFPVGGEKLFGDLNSASLTSIYSPLSPDNIYPTDNAIKIFTYAQDKGASAGIRSYVGDSKVVYLAFGLEQVSSNAMQDSIILRTYKWFNGDIDLDVNDVINENSLKLFPNPSNKNINIACKQLIGKDASIKIFNSQGSCIAEDNIRWENNYQFNIENFSNGIYFISIQTELGNKQIKFVKN